MGSKCAPAVACTYMAEFERQYIYSLPPEEQPLLWVRFIDDCFCLWTHGQEALDKFTNYLNSCTEKIKFTREMPSANSGVAFLDTLVRIKDRRIHTELYIKPTSSLSYLHRESCHPKSTFKSLPYGEFLRIRRICSDLEDYDKHARSIEDGFLKRGYDSSALIEAREKA